MQRTKIEWATHTWNPMTGCTYGCSYCFARKLTIRFPQNFPYGFTPTFHLDRVWEKMPRKPARIFTVDMGDFWDPAFTNEERVLVLERMEAHPQHRFLILTKRPEKISEDPNIFPPNLWLGVTVDLPGMEYRIDELLAADVEHPFVSFEPLLGEVDPELGGIDWVIIGQQTNPSIPVEPEWLHIILDEADRHQIPVFQKNNLRVLQPRHQFPKDLIFT